MLTVQLETDRAWINSADDPSGAHVTCGTNMRSGTTWTLDGEVRHYAGNLVEPEVRDQDDRNVQVTLVHVSPAERRLLIDWRGRNILFRTVDGDRFFGVYFQVTDRRVLRTTPDDNSDDLVTYDLDVTITQISMDEAV